LCELSGQVNGLVTSVPPGRQDPTQHPDHPTQSLLRDPRRLKLFKGAFSAAFDRNVVVDAWGQSIRLRLSEDLKQDAFATESADGLPPPELMQRLETLPLIETQSDGVKSFAGILLTLLTVPYSLILLDEPEAFLHPPQARLLGRYLGTLRQEGQLFVATHSLDVLLGLLSTVGARVQVVRLTRTSDESRAQVLDPDRLRSLWKDPLLRFSRAFDGLFHEAVVVCEGDTDSQFYSAVAVWLAEHEQNPPVEDDVSEKTAGQREGESEEEPPSEESKLDIDPGMELSHFTANPFDVMFTYAGSKQRMAQVAQALRSVRVPVRIVADFDVLNDQQVLKRLIESLGAEYSDEIESLRTVIDSGLRGSDRKLMKSDFVKELTILLEDVQEITPDEAKRIRPLLESHRGWARARTRGEAEVPSGDPSQSLKDLLGLLAECGLFVVRSGAVESFVREVGNTGPKWVVEVIDSGYVEQATDAQDFVRAILEEIGTRRG
jgi:hypothetical protein